MRANTMTETTAEFTKLNWTEIQLGKQMRCGGRALAQERNCFRVRLRFIRFGLLPAAAAVHTSKLSASVQESVDYLSLEARSKPSEV
jgi:hypothetical protein